MQIIKENCINNKRKQKFESIFFPKDSGYQKWKKINWSKSQETKFSETHFAQKNWNRDVWEKKKNTKISGQKLLETSICVKKLKQKIRKKYKEKS